jgi:hypothetical protein
MGGDERIARKVTGRPDLLPFGAGASSVACTLAAADAALPLLVLAAGCRTPVPVRCSGAVEVEWSGVESAVEISGRARAHSQVATRLSLGSGVGGSLSSCAVE